jgi:hypothetical protein
MKKTSRTGIRKGTIGAGLAAVLLASMALATLPIVFASSASYNNVQVFVTTQATLDYNYFFTAYNLTGQLIGTTQTPYPAAAFELPAGTYLFTVSAINQTSYGCYLCAQPLTGATGSGSAAGTPSTGSAPAKNGSVLPIFYRPAAEYGYKVVQVSGPENVGITTQNTTGFPTSPVTVKVSFVNGTAASGAWVSASVVGQWYYWWGNDPAVVMSAQTDKSGIATLTLPVAPAVVDAWDWVRVNLPASQTTTQVDVGGQTVNVTVYWEPTYVGLAASTLIIPPASSVNLTLHYQQPNFWVTPAGTEVQPGVPGTSSSSAVSNAPTGVPSGSAQASSQQGTSSQYYLPTAIPTMAAGSGTQASPSSTSPFLGALAEGALVGAALASAAALAIFGARRKQSSAKVA